MTWGDVLGVLPFSNTLATFRLTGADLRAALENGLAGEIDQAGAYMWYALAAKGGDQDAVARRDALKSTLGATALKSAEAKIAGFRARRAAPLANDARAAGEDWKKRVNNDTNT